MSFEFNISNNKNSEFSRTTCCDPNCSWKDHQKPSVNTQQSAFRYYSLMSPTAYNCNQQLTISRTRPILDTSVKVENLNVLCLMNIIEKCFDGFNFKELKLNGKDSIKECARTLNALRSTCKYYYNIKRTKELSEELFCLFKEKLKNYCNDNYNELRRRFNIEIKIEIPIENQNPSFLNGAMWLFDAGNSGERYEEVNGEIYPVYSLTHSKDKWNQTVEQDIRDIVNVWPESLNVLATTKGLKTTPFWEICMNKQCHKRNVSVELIEFLFKKGGVISGGPSLKDFCGSFNKFEQVFK